MDSGFHYLAEVLASQVRKTAAREDWKDIGFGEVVEDAYVNCMEINISGKGTSRVGEAE